MPKINFPTYLIFALAAALVYCIPVFIFIQLANFTQTVLLYLGNFLLMGVITLFLFYVSRKKDDNSSALTLMMGGEITVLLSIVLACLLSLILLLILVPGLFHSGDAGKFLSNAPATTIQGNTNGLAFMVFLNAVIGNLFAGSFVSIILPFSLKKEQRTEKGSQKRADLI